MIITDNIKKTEKRSGKPGHRPVVTLFISSLLIILATAVGIFISRTGNKETLTFAIFGIDDQPEWNPGFRSDSIMLLTVTPESGEMRLCSVMRDLMVQIPEHDGKDASFEKINMAFHYGGPELELEALNRNFDLNIQDYVSVNWSAMIGIVDALGGVDVKIANPQVLDAVNGRIDDYVWYRMDTDPDYTPEDGAVKLTHYGSNHLNGIQALAYCRTRFSDSDYARTERQREVITEIYNKVLKADAAEVLKLIRIFYGSVETSFPLNDILSYSTLFLQAKSHTLEKTRLPFDRAMDEAKIDELWYVTPTSLSDNARILHGFLFNDGRYMPSETVNSISRQIGEITGQQSKINWKSSNWKSLLKSQASTNQYWQKAEDKDINRKEEIRGVWVSTINGLDFPSRSDLTGDEMQSEIDYLVDFSVNLGFNAIFLQVRPCCDAIYPSDIFPTSKYLVGVQGGELPDGFDPLAYWIEAAHERGLTLHAWINPYRVTSGGRADAPVSAELLSPDHPIRKDPSLAVLHTDGNIYLDPGLPQARQLIIDGIHEICENYDVDGIHFDDYFYPYEDAYLFDDMQTFLSYVTGRDDIAAFRRNSVNTLVREVGEYCRTQNVLFGISPSGIWRNRSSDPLGSSTNGFESYDSLYADSRTWVKNEWVDYIAPQIYWEFGNSAADYKVLADWWADVTEGTGVSLLIGHAGYLVSQADDPDSVWYGETGANEIIRQIEYARSLHNYGGSIHFRLRKYIGTPLDSILPAFYDASEDIPPIYTGSGSLCIGDPVPGFTVSAETYFIQGTSNPKRKLFMNGEKITRRTKNGTFGVFVQLEPGINTFEFTQRGQKKAVCTILRQTAAEAAAADDKSAPVIPNRYELNAAAEITSPISFLYPEPYSSDPIGYITQNMAVHTLSSDGEWLQLDNGYYIRCADAKLSYGEFAGESILGTEYSVGEETDSICFYLTGPAAARIAAEGDRLKVIFSGVKNSSRIDLRGNLFTAFSVETHSDSMTAEYYFRLSDSGVDGWWTEADGSSITVFFKHRGMADPSADKPLTGKVIVLDAGHGGSDGGAKGAFGSIADEKTCNYFAVKHLQKELTCLGATVVLTRRDDTNVSLEERLLLSWNVKPDIFLSIHNNSFDKTQDIYDICGTLTLYRENNGKALAQLVQEGMTVSADGPMRKSLGVREQNLYVCRGDWCPHILIETGFISSPMDIDWLVSEEGMSSLAESIAQSIVNYYSS